MFNFFRYENVWFFKVWFKKVKVIVNKFLAFIDKKLSFERKMIIWNIIFFILGRILLSGETIISSGVLKGKFDIEKTYRKNQNKLRTSHCNNNMVMRY